jgi:amidophosphoribosyltransferase
MKLSPVRTIVKGKRVVLVDDSIVRGTTSLKIVKMLREAGAAEVHVRIASAPLKYTCYYGVDVHSPKELISNANSVEQVCKLIDADSLAFLSHEGMLAAGHRDDLCLACFNHEYPTDLYEE